MHYSEDTTQCRVDIWKSSGKWYTTISLTWHDWAYNNRLIHETFKKLMEEQHKGHWTGMTATCLSPHHEHGHPLMIKL